MSLRFSRLTRPAIRALNSREKISEHGITAERQPNGDCRYSINIMADGQRIHRVIGRESDGVTREQAERTIEVLRTKAREGRLDLPAGRKVHRSFKEAAAEYLERLEQIGGKGINDKRRHLETRLTPYFGIQRADRLTHFTVQHYVRSRLNEGAKQATVNRELSTLSHMLRRMAEWKWISPDAVPKITKGPEPRKQIVVLTAEHQQALIRGAVADQDPLTWLFVAFGLNTGMRHSEILRVRWDQIEFEQRRIYIAKAKAGQREQPITAALAALLEKERQQREEADGFVFSVTRRDGKRGHRLTMTRQFERAAKRAGLEPRKVTPHVMRHTAITQLVKAGVDLPTIQRISGHKTLAMVMRYVHLSGEHIDTAIAAIETPLPDAITPELHSKVDKAARLHA
jgi:integrase